MEVIRAGGAPIGAKSRGDSERFSEPAVVNTLVFSGGESRKMGCHGLPFRFSSVSIPFLFRFPFERNLRFASRPHLRLFQSFSCMVALTLRLGPLGLSFLAIKQP